MTKCWASSAERSAAGRCADRPRGTGSARPSVQPRTSLRPGTRGPSSPAECPSWTGPMSAWTCRYGRAEVTRFSGAAGRGGGSGHVGRWDQVAFGSGRAGTPLELAALHWDFRMLGRLLAWVLRVRVCAFSTEAARPVLPGPSSQSLLSSYESGENLWGRWWYLHGYRKTFSSLYFSVVFKTLLTCLKTNTSCPLRCACRRFNGTKWGKGLRSYPSAPAAHLFVPNVVCRVGFPYTVIDLYFKVGCCNYIHILGRFLLQLWIIITHSVKQSSISERS